MWPITHLFNLKSVNVNTVRNEIRTMAIKIVSISEYKLSNNCVF